MKTWVHSAMILLACLVGTACDKGQGTVADEDPTMVSLNLDVALTDDPASYAAATGDNEKMQTLRIIIVRPDGTVEANRYIEITKAVVTYGYETFKVRGNEIKRIYLLVNEQNTRLIDNGTPVGDTWEFFRAIRPGDTFPAERIARLTVGLDTPSAQLAGPLPMNESHEVEVGDKDQACTLFVTRAAVKFSVRIVNRGTDARQLTGLAIEKMADRAYYMPRDAVYDPDAAAEGNNQKAIVSYTTPADAGYYRFELLSDELPLTLPTGDEEATLKPIYLLEGKYVDPDAPAVADGPARNYRIALSIDGHRDLLTGYLPNLPQLPRNTHAVVTVTIGAGSDLTCMVDVVPYGEVILDPSFGI